MSRLKSCLFGACDPAGNCSQIGYTLFRVFIGLGMALGHGLGKIKAPGGFIENVGKMGLPLSDVMGWAAILAEFIGGLLIAVGLLTRPSAFFLAITMAVAAFMVHAQDDFATKERALLYLASCIAIMAFGAGKFGIDSMIAKKK